MALEQPALGTILLVEDNPSDARLLIRAFSKAGVRNPIKHLPEGETAQAFLEGTDQFGDRQLHPLPILILLDLNLPRIPGLELLRWIRLQRTLRRIPVLVLTSERNDKFMEAAYAAGANSYLLKSFDSEEIDRVVNLITAYWLSLNESPLVVNRALSRPG
ncbi:MAG TPA: response regulator [Candidatus Angelobacter sp.]|jgi:CheY-like chemotaxis protein|nr:response regulator [Candidatus Angelobacter sp.]